MTTNTTPVSTPLDTLKAVTLRTRERLDFVIDQLGGGGDVIAPAWLLDYIEGIRTTVTDALGEHVPITIDETYGLFPVLSTEAYTYSNGDPVRSAFTSDGVTSVWFPRYDGTYDENLQRHHESVARLKSERGPHGPTQS